MPTDIGLKKLKGLQKQNLRDHMADLELIFKMLGEALTTENAIWFENPPTYKMHVIWLKKKSPHCLMHCDNS
jgi:hypothetical protein